MLKRARLSKRIYYIKHGRRGKGKDNSIMKKTAINEAITTYLETEEKCEKEKIQVAPFEVK